MLLEMQVKVVELEMGGQGRDMLGPGGDKVGECGKACQWKFIEQDSLIPIFYTLHPKCYSSSS